MNFKIGDEVVYPMHGAGIIEDIEEKKILGELRRYFVLKIPFGDMRILIPIDSTNEIGVRGIITECELSPVWSLLAQEPTEMSDNWNRRYRENMEKLKTGHVLEVAEVVRNLMITDKEKRLSTGERKMLSNAKQILISEILLVLKIQQQEANDMIVSAVFK
ncbi:MAG: CarD family transcriptional regulator [Eubacteriales bacterium]